MSAAGRRIVVFGAEGMLGRAVTATFERRGDTVVPSTRADYDIARGDFGTLCAIVAGADAVVNCAGIIKPRIAALSVEDVLRVNAIFPRTLVRAARGVRVFHVTTDCVYSGAEGGYDENAPVDADDLYGLSKAAGDDAGAMVLRTSIVGEEQPPGRSLLAWAMSQRGTAVNGFTNHRWNGVTTAEFARIVAAVLDADAYEAGCFHIHSPEVLTKFEMLRLFDEVYRLDLDVVPVAAAQPCDRSLRSLRGLAAGFGTPSFREQLVHMRAFFEPLARGSLRRAAKPEGGG